jgi:hypothetical protein
MTTTAPPPQPVPAARPELQPYPVRVEAVLYGPLSRWRWLVKWLLIVPHVLLLIPLWIAFAFSCLAALVAIVATGRYPRGLFDFNVGVLRWSWRVGYYSYSVLGTDRYPPFTLADRPDYPARLDVEYPQHLSRGLALVKWLLAIPHYIILGIFFGGGAWLTWQVGSEAWSWGSPGLVGVLVLIAGVILTVTGNYPQPLFDLIMGLNRWAQRVAGYSALMTDRYPPFRFDLGGDESQRTDALPAATTTNVPADPTGSTARTGDGG